MNAAAQTTRPVNARFAAARAKMEADRAALLNPYASLFAQLEAEGAVVEASSFLPTPAEPFSLVNVRVWIFDQKGRPFIAAKFTGYNGCTLRGFFSNEPACTGGECEASELVAVARAARRSRVN